MPHLAPCAHHPPYTPAGTTAGVIFIGIALLDVSYLLAWALAAARDRCWRAHRRAKYAAQAAALAHGAGLGGGNEMGSLPLAKRGPAQAAAGGGPVVGPGALPAGG